MAVEEVQSVVAYRPIIEAQIRRLVALRLNSNSDAPVAESECSPFLEEIKNVRTETDPDAPNVAHWPPVETVFREYFDNLVATVEIFDPAFQQVWILLDVITILSDADLCEPALNFWLIEELLDSQAINGCRKVFDYLESRRERITAKHFKLKSLVILRCCNELLRRLSRAEDTVFCGRVFIFLFQSFPLGDKSSVNLRGEFHVENVTIFDPAPKKSEDAIKPMEIDTEGGQPISSGAQTPASTTQETDPSQKTGRSTPAARSVKADSKVEEPPDLDALYPRFWSLQAFFSSPTRLFESSGLATFKDGISATMSCFKSVSNSSSPNTSATDLRRGIKRKRSELDTNPTTASTFNPKYLTNRDLFDLEVHDIAFRRHILVQALIMLDFLLSLTPAAKSKFDGLTNKSVLYTYTLSDDDAKWATSTRASIASYLQQGNGNEGKFYYRMVDTVLSRDKNWVRWKAENCPAISRPAVDVAMYMEAQRTLAKMCEKTTLPAPPGASDLNFLDKSEALEALKRPSQRLKVPTMAEYWKGIQGDELDKDFAMTEEEKKEIDERKAGRVWRALRASGERFVLCEKIKDGSNLKALVGEDEAELEEKGDGDKSGEIGDGKGEPLDGSGEEGTSEDIQMEGGERAELLDVDEAEKEISEHAESSHAADDDMAMGAVTMADAPVVETDFEADVEVEVEDEDAVEAEAEVPAADLDGDEAVAA